MYVHMLLVMQVTKVDMCPANILKQTLDELTKILKSPVRSILFMKWRFFFSICGYLIEQRSGFALARYRD